MFNLIVEFWGSFMLAFGAQTLHGFDFVFLLWFIIGVGAKVSGAHYNWAVTLSFQIRREKHFNRLYGFAYYPIQVIGCTAGAFAGWYFSGKAGGMTVQPEKTVL